ncbi:hypothetical protein [Oceanicoccus sp. KOV_DT_Chl]|uniref:hypothetical protein n=1 Tax=Oceanicoccus sp. KOV_DT_Chl TaxID=1904639 RepID=UPI0011AF3140|nr:hypothetical protein [Oceanicoccus sp. KOV_DT_Chl]
MTTVTTTSKSSTLTQGIIVAMLMTLASSAHSAGYIKFDGVDGETKTKPVPQRVDSKNKPQPASLLLPAVQQVREAASSKPKTRDNGHSAGDEHEITYDIAAGV